MTRLEMEAVINGGGTVLWNGKIHYTIEELPTQEEINALTAPPSIGPEGLSAYEVAVEEGFVGTVEQWLDSLEGATGPEGPQGPQGEPGEGTGDVIGPASSTDNNIAVFDGVTGKLLKDGGADISSLATDADLTSGLATKEDSLGFTPVPDTRTVNGHALSADVTVTKSDVGLGNVDNTSDTNKPVSTAQQTALDTKQNLDSDLTAIAGLAPTDDDVIQRKAGAWTNRTITQLKADLNIAGADVQEFTASGTWTKPAGCKAVLVVLVGAGGGGGGGAVGATAGRSGGAGGNGGSYLEVLLPASMLGSSESVTIGTGGAGGAGAVAAGSGSAGSVGGDSSFGTTFYFKAQGGNGGGAGSSSGSSSAGSDRGVQFNGSSITSWTAYVVGMTRANMLRGGIGGISNVAASGGGGLRAKSVTENFMCPTGGGGGGCSDTNATFTSGGGTGFFTSSDNVHTGNGTNGAAWVGGGGGVGKSGAGGLGGNGGTAAGGGGGGFGTAAGGGTGGNGGNGYAIIISW
jgi:hypothetical protein